MLRRCHKWVFAKLTGSGSLSCIYNHAARANDGSLSDERASRIIATISFKSMCMFDVAGMIRKKDCTMINQSRRNVTRKLWVKSYRLRNKAHWLDIFLGVGGGMGDVATWNRAAKLFVNSGHGGLPVALRRTLEVAAVSGGF